MSNCCCGIIIGAVEAFGGVSAPRATFVAGFPRISQLLPPQTPAKGSEP